MKVIDLVKGAHGMLTDMEVIIRDHGKWVYGYRIGENAAIYRCEHCAEYQELRGQFGVNWLQLKPGQSAEVTNWGSIKTKVICCEVSKAPKEVLELEVNYYQPRHIPEFHKEQLTHNDFAMEIVCYPPDNLDQVNARIEAAQKKDDGMEGQMSLDQFYETEEIGRL